jgi:hypothetical protein
MPKGVYLRNALPADRFRQYFRKSADPDDCWLWTGLTKKGYGYFVINARQVRAHRFSYELVNGPIPDGYIVCHRCDNPACVNPAHLFLGTATINMADKMGKGREARGARIKKSTLTDADIRVIRARYSAGETQRAIAADFGVTNKAVGYIVRRQTWTHVDP